MKKMISYIAVILLVLDTIVSMGVLLHPSNMLTLSTVAVVWSIYALFALGTVAEVCHEDTQRLLGYDRRKFWKENRKFWKEYEKRMKEVKWQ